MNERLLDICIKAGINTWPFNEVGFISLDESELVKFAELIVKKCTKLIEQSIEDDEYWSRTTGAESIMAIEEHFGVEE